MLPLYYNSCKKKKTKEEEKKKCMLKILHKDIEKKNFLHLTIA